MAFYCLSRLHADSQRVNNDGFLCRPDCLILPACNRFTIFTRQIPVDYL